MSADAERARAIRKDGRVQKLTELIISECSAVDFPASMLPGYMVMKARHAARHPETGRFQPAADAAAARLVAARTTERDGNPAFGGLDGIPHNRANHVRVEFR
jgi:hypothetical protein